MKRYFALSLVGLFTLISCSDKPLYQSERYNIYPHKVIQGEFVVEALSAGELTSNYRSDYRRPTKRAINFKFSINGNDNERFPGEDHSAILPTSGGKSVSAIYVFGQPDPDVVFSSTLPGDPYLQGDVDFLLRADMRKVMDDFNSKGYFVTKTGAKIKKEEFNGVFVAGNTQPLSWNFAQLSDHSELRMEDPDGDGIYELALRFRKYQGAAPQAKGNKKWKREKDISGFPSYSSSQLLIDAIYAMSLEELQQDIRKDGAFMAGMQWPGVWTRDISYSILLSLASIAPEVGQKSLKMKVKNDRIIQDTGTGGSWPVSTDRVTWALAAWEIYKVTGEREWLRYAYKIIRNTAHDDLATAYNPASGLFYGESSFLDWREQTYPLWMDPKDIYKSQCLGTNAVHYQTYFILARMAAELGENETPYQTQADKVKKAIKKILWLPDKGYYGQFSYGRNFMSISAKSETLGEALAILFAIADDEKSNSIVEKMPLSEFGPTCVFPQIPDIPPYHNNAIWPFVTAYWTWASAQVKNERAVEHGLASVYRAAALFLTNKENMVAQSGDYMGTEINSDRQLWSVAGNLAMVYRVFFGMQYKADSLFLNPFIPEAYCGQKALKNFPYRKAKLNIQISGFGDGIKEVKLDGQKIPKAAFPGTIEGPHTITIAMNGHLQKDSKINRVENQIAPHTPITEIVENRLKWVAVDSAVNYTVFKNGKVEAETSDTFYNLSRAEKFAEYQVMAVDSRGLESFLSEPVLLNKDPNQIQVYKLAKRSAGKNNYVEISKKKNKRIDMQVKVNSSSTYSLDCLYANGSGPINTNNRCAIRSLLIDNRVVGKIVMPQRGNGKWDDWGYSNSLQVKLKKGRHKISILFDSTDKNMNGEVNRAFLKYLRLLPI